MVVLTLTPHRGNGARSFPCTGYLGLSPVTVAGVIRTKLEEDRRPIRASSVLVRVRCYESMGSGSTLTSSSSSSSTSSSPSLSSVPLNADEGLKGNLNGKGRVLWEKSLEVWSPPLSEESPTVLNDKSMYTNAKSTPSHFRYADLGDFQQPWRLVIPLDAITEGAKSTMIFKTWRIWWAVEAVISHKPAGIHGDRMTKSHQLALLNYAAPPSTALPLLWSTPLQQRLLLEYTVKANSASFGSSDPLSLSFQLKKKGAAEAPKRVSVELRREITFAQSGSPTTSYHFEPVRQTGRRGSAFVSNHRSSSSLTSLKNGSNEPHTRSTQPLCAADAFELLTPPPIIPTPLEYHEALTESYFGLFGSAGASRANNHHAIVSPLSHQTNPKRRKEDVSLATYETDVHLDTQGCWNGQIVCNLPRAKSLYHYALGESCKTASACSRFYLVVRVHFRQRGNFIELAQKDINFTSISTEERMKASQQLTRIFAIQKAEARLFGEGDHEKPPSLKRVQSAESRLGIVRRRSELPESMDSPRTRIRFGSDPYSLSLVATSPNLSLGSPSLSNSSSATQRCRSGPRKSVASTHSGRSVRSKSSGGLVLSSASTRTTTSVSSGTLAATAKFSQIDLTSSSSLSSVNALPQFEIQPENDENTSPACSLFADFTGFTLRPPKKMNMTVPEHREEYIPPKAGSAGPLKDTSRPKGLPSYSIHHFPLTTTSTNSSAAESAGISKAIGSTSPASAALPSNRMLSRPVISRTSSHTSQVVEPISNPALGIGRKSNSTVFAFFRRGSKALM